MNHYPISPIYFPTTVLFVDDSIDFLSNLSLKLDRGLAFQLHDSPDNTLALLNSENNANTPMARFFSRFHHTDDVPMSHHVIDVNLDKVHREVYNEFRFELVSVVVADYDMPGMNGIELCRRIKNPAIKRILLTGKADEKIAVQAFNEGLIDRFIVKHDVDVFKTLNHTITQMQQEFFQQTERMLADSLTIDKHEFLRDPLFAEKFQEICAELNIVEYYLCCNPDGVLMLDANGRSHLLLVPDDEYQRCQFEIAFDQSAPQKLLDMLTSNSHLPYFWRTGYWVPECTDWEQYFYPAKEFKGKKWYSYSIISDPPVFKTDLVYSYREFLEEQDQVKWTGK